MRPCSQRSVLNWGCYDCCIMQRFGLGIRGAAWATVGSQYVGAVVLLRALQKSKVCCSRERLACSNARWGSVHGEQSRNWV